MAKYIFGISTSRYETSYASVAIYTHCYSNETATLFCWREWVKAKDFYRWIFGRVFRVISFAIANIYSRFKQKIKKKKKKLIEKTVIVKHHFILVTCFVLYVFVALFIHFTCVFFFCALYLSLLCHTHSHIWLLCNVNLWNMWILYWKHFHDDTAAVPSISIVHHSVRYWIPKISYNSWIRKKK